MEVTNTLIFAPVGLSCLIQFFIINRTVHKLTNKFHPQSKLHLSGLLLLAAFLKHSDDLYERSGVQMEAWLVLGWL